MIQYVVSENIYLEAGPQIGFMIKREEKVIKYPTDDPDFNRVSEFDNDILDLGLASGIGYELNQKITLNL